MTSVPETTVPATEAPATTASPATTESTTTTVEATTTTVDVEALKAQIAADYLRSWELRRELTANPTLDGLDEQLAQISAPGSEDYATLQSVHQRAGRRWASGRRRAPRTSFGSTSRASICSG